MSRFLFSLATIISLAFPVAAQAEGQLRAVVEMFTSQGCSSCPPADDILAEYAKNGDILALSWHVDYWNYLGWSDTFSKRAFTERQYRYAASFGRRSVYTPQAVVNGGGHAVGSRKRAIEKLIRKSGPLPVKLNISRNAGDIQVTTNGAAGDATLWIVYFDRSLTVNIERGENRGRSITYHNIVRDVAMAGMMKSGAIDITLPAAELKRRGHEGYALILQRTTKKGGPGEIVGAAYLTNFGS